MKNKEQLKEIVRPIIKEILMEMKLKTPKTAEEARQ